MAAGSIVVDLLMRTGSFETDTKRAEARLKALSKEAKASARELAGAFGLASGALAGFTSALGVAGFTAFIRSTVNGIDHLNDLADATGSSVENLSALEDIAARTGTGIDSVGQALEKFNRGLADTKSDSATTQALKQIGLSAAELRKLDPAQALKQTADALAKFADDGNKARLVQELFGKSVREVAPFLKDLAEAGRLNATVTTEQAKQAEAFNKQMFEFQKNISDAARRLTFELLPAMSEIAKGFAGGGFRGALDAFGEQIGFGKAYYGARNMKILSEEIAGLQKQLDAPVMFGRDPALVAELEQKKAKLDDLTRSAKVALAAQRALASINDPSNYSNEGYAGFKSVGAARDDEPGKRTATRVSEFERYRESLERQFQATKDLSVAETALLEIQSGRLGKVSDAQKSALLGVAEQIDMAKRLKDQFQAEDQQLKDLKASQDALREAGRAVYESTRTPAEKLGTELDRLNGLLQHGAVDWDTYSRAVFAAQEAFDETSKSQKKVATELDEFAKNAAENLQRSFGDVLVDAMNGNFKNIGDGFKQMLDRMVAEAIAAKLVRSLFGESGNGSGFFGNVLGTVGAALGFGGARALGGDVMPDRSYLVGENGPERFVPRTFGSILPNTDNATSGRSAERSVVVHQAIYVSGKPDHSTVLQIASETSRKLRTAETRNQ